MRWHYRNETTKWEWRIDTSRASFIPTIERYFRDDGREIIVISEDEFITVRSDGWVVHRKRM